MENNIFITNDDTFDDADKVIDSSPFPDNCQNETIGIEFFSKCFERRYDACPVFFVGSLRAAFQEAFSPTLTQERRPVLVYIHNDKNLYSNIFCKTTLCSTKIIDYLLDNYIVWPWDITLESNRNTLTNIWEEIFSTKFFDDFSIEQCPLLIGITRLFEYKKDELITSEYQFKSLFKGDILTLSKQTINREILLNELVIFKTQHNINELDLAFDFVGTTGICWEIILEIAKYLPLNDTISIFSTKILQLLNNSKLRFQLSNPTPPWIKMILQNFRPEQIVSLQLDTHRLWSEINLSIFKDVISMTLLNLPYNDPITEYERIFPALTCLSLCYDHEINFDSFISVLKQFWHRIKRFEIHCAGTLCTHYDTDQLRTLYLLNSSIEYFLFDVGHFPLIPMGNCYGYYRLCFLITTMKFIKTMMNIRYIHFIINKYDIEQLLDIDEWKSLVNKCVQLKKITLEVLGNTFQNEELTQKVLNIQTELRKIQQTIKFQIKFL